MKTMKLLMDYPLPNPLIPVIYALVACWGRVIEHRDGYRSQYQYPVRVWLPRPEIPGFPRSPHLDRMLATIQDRYGCEIGPPPPS
jgi:hypothetical protein